MTHLAQVPFSDVTFVDNPEPRCPCVLLLDTSSSMSGARINQLNAGLKQFQKELAADAMASKRVEIAIITFGPVRVVQDFITPDLFAPTELVAEGDTPMGAAIAEALELIRLRKQQYQANGVAYYRPWVFLITDGAPTDHCDAAASAIKDGERTKSIAFFPVGVDEADFSTLQKLSVRAPIKLRGLMFRELFQWLSNSLSGVSRPPVRTTITMSNPLIQIDDRQIVLLSGFQSEPGKRVVVTAKEELEAAAKRHSDAVAFGYVSGRWTPAA